MPEIPRYPDCGRDCDSLNAAVALLLDLGVDLADTVRVYYVEDRLSFYQTRYQAFSYNFFSPEGRNVGSYSPTMHRFSFQAGPDGKGRHWGKHLDKTHQAESIEYSIGVWKRSKELAHA